MAVDIRELLHHAVCVENVFRDSPVVREDVLGEDWRDDVADVALLVIYVICPPLARLADGKPAVEVRVFRPQAAVLVENPGAEVLHVRQSVHVPIRVRVLEHAGTHIFAVGYGHLPAVDLPLLSRLVQRGGLRRQEAVILRAGEGSGVGILRLGQAGNRAADDEGAVGGSDGQPASRLSPVFVIFVVHHDARQRGAAEGPYLLHDVAKAVVVGALDEFHRTVGRQERPGDDAAAGWGLRTNGTNG